MQDRRCCSCVLYPPPLETDCNTTWALLDRSKCHVSLQTHHISYGLAEFLTVCKNNYCFIQTSNPNHNLSQYPLLENGRNQTIRVQLNIGFTIQTAEFFQDISSKQKQEGVGIVDNHTDYSYKTLSYSEIVREGIFWVRLRLSVVEGVVNNTVSTSVHHNLHILPWRWKSKAGSQ
jgi:hypothetical protein